MGLLNELKRRNVIRMAGLYLVGAWLVVQVLGSLLPMFGAPDWLARSLVVVIAVGFVPALVFAWIYELTPDGLKRDADVPPEASIATQTGRRIDRAIIAVLAVALIVFAVDKFVLAPQREAARVAAAVAQVRQAPAVATTPTIPAMPSIAVLPFVDMSQDKDQEYFSDGLSEELLNLLAQLPQLRVIARTSSFSFKGKEADVATIAKALNVEHILEGSVRKSGNTLRITAQLIRVSDSSHLWSQTYDRQMTDVFAVQDEIAKAVVDALKVKLLPDQALVNHTRSNNTEAYTQYLIGNQFFNLGNPENWERARAAYERAIALDPDYGAAYAGLAATRYHLADSLGASKQEALVAADTAVAKAPQLADAYAARGITRLSFRRDWPGAQADFEKALALNANNSAAQIGYWRLLMALGRQQDAVTTARKATELDPMQVQNWASLGRALNGVRDFAAANAALQRALEISPASAYVNFTLGMNQLLQDRPEQALAAFNAAAGGYHYAGVAMAQHSLGHHRESDAALAEGIANYPGGSYQFAQAYAWRGEDDKAFEWLERAYAQDDGGITFLRSDAILSRYQDDPRYLALRKKLGFPE